ncbi:MAG: Gfo/Idh/MocA family oxidoreductase [Verrucomicrobia bacterium]|nr:Gfo/Idh/MocA family oxidoreductase [Verrucomicrobiota bacterium]MBV9673730.1 Gfo/Idh/MocA family oxidoreductase [Verrucomicrobiota bacterium]
MKERLKWGILSTAAIAQNVTIPALQESTYGQVELIGSRDLEKARNVASALGIKRAAGSYEEVIEDPDIDAVYIALPNSLHAEWTIRAAEAGKAILCDKPIAVTVDEATREIEACTKHSVSLMEGFMYRFHPQTKRVQELLASGAIGQVRDVRAHLSVNIMRELDPTNIRYQKGLGGGVLLDMGCYTVNISRMIFGQEPVRVTATGHVDPSLGVETRFAGVLEFTGGFASVSCSFDADGQGAYSVVGTEGMIDVPRGILPGLGSRVPEGLVIIVDANGGRREEMFHQTNQYRNMFDAFSEAVLNDKPVPILPGDSLKNVKVLEALKSSISKSAAVAV